MSMNHSVNINGYASPETEVMEVIAEGVFCTSMNPSDLDMGNDN